MKYHFFRQYVCAIGCSLFSQSVQANPAPLGSTPTRETVEGVFSTQHLTDTIQVQFFRFHFFGVTSDRDSIYTCIAKKGHFRFSLPAVNKVAYFTLALSTLYDNKILLNQYLIEPGDRIFIDARGKSPIFTGPGASKYRCRSLMDTVSSNWYVEQPKTITDSHDEEPVEVYYAIEKRAQNRADRLLLQRLDLLKQFPEALTEFEKFLLRTDCVGDRYRNLFYGVRYALLYDGVRDNLGLANLQYYTDHYTNFLLDTTNGNRLIYSRSYADAAIQQEKLVSLMTANDGKFPSKMYTFKGLFESINSRYQGLFRQRLITGAFAEMYDYLDSADFFLAEALKLVTVPYFQAILKRLANSKLAGAAGYPFELEDSAGKLVHFTDFAGQVMVIHFWYTGCGACRHMADGLKLVTKHYGANKAVVFLTINIDSDKNLWKNSLLKGGYTSSEEINLNTGSAGLDHPLIKFYELSAFPELFIFDKKGRMFTSHPPTPWDDNLQKAKQFEDVLQKALDSE